MVSALAALAVSAAGCSSNGHSTSGATTVATSDPAAAVGRVGSSGTGPLDTVPLQGPNASALQEVQYLTDAAEADPTLASYLQTNGDVATHALLTAGAAFCAFLQRGGGLDNAMVSVAVGARGVESQTHLPTTVTTFNTVEAVALLTLCPSEQKLVPAEDRTKIQGLGQALSHAQG